MACVYTHGYKVCTNTLWVHVALEYTKPTQTEIGTAILFLRRCSPKSLLLSQNDNGGGGSQSFEIFIPSTTQFAPSSFGGILKINQLSKKS